MKKKFSIIALFVLVALVALPIAVAATTISFSPLNLDEETLLFHNSSGTLIGVYNTSTKGIVLDNNESYSILVQPSNSNLMVNHPDTWFSNFIAWGTAGNRFIGLVMLFFLGAMLILAYKRR